jgi:streptogramin lyase
MRAMRMLLLVVAIALQAAPALAEPHVEFTKPMPGVQTNGQLTPGPDGNIWVVLHDAIARVTPDGTVTTYTSTHFTDLGSPEGGIAAADGAIWVSQPPQTVKSILKITPGDPPVATGVTVTDIDGGATAMTRGPDGNIWVGLPGKLVKFPTSDPANSTVYPFPGVSPKCMTASPDGTLWVADATGQALLNVTTSGSLVHAAYPTGSAPQCLAAGTAGQVTVGLPINSPQQIGQLTPNGTVQTLNRPDGSDPFGVAFGADGAFWVAEFAGHRLARVTTGGQLTTLAIPDTVSTRGPRQITARPNNTLWATLDDPSDPNEPNSQIAKISGVDPPTTGGGGGPGGGGPGGGTPPPDTTPPAVTAVALSKTKLPVGTRTVTLRFTLSEAGSAQLVVSRRLPGRRRGTACVKPTRKLRKAKRCTRLVRVKTVKANAVAGANAVRIAIRTLRPGRYGVTLTVADGAGNRANPVTRTFTITKRRRG